MGKWAEARAVGNAQRCPRPAGRFERQLELSNCPQPNSNCERPLFPAHSAFAGSAALASAGYAPSRKNSINQPQILISQITSFDVEPRERINLNEETIVFDAPESEGATRAV